MTGHDTSAAGPLPFGDRTLEAVADGLVVADARQQIVFVNSAFAALTGYDRDELLGQNCRILQGPETDPEVLALMRLCLAHGEMFRGQVLNYHHDGSTFWNALSISPVRGGDHDEITHFISVHRDVTPHVAAPAVAHAPRAVETKKAPGQATVTGQGYRERLLNGGLVMLMQPVVDLRTGQLWVVESLARLELEDGTLISPGAFLPLLTDSDIALLFRQALHQVLGQMAEWDQLGLHLTASINLSPSTLRDPECVRWVADALEQHSIEPARLGIELLETEVLHDAIQLDTFEELRALGLGLAMDDLGSGHSGLRRLLQLRFDAVKVDAGIVAQVRIHPLHTLRLLTTLIQMGRDNDWDMVLEGLEDAALTEVATILGAPFGQGFFLSPPLHPRDMPAWLRDRCWPDRDVVHTYLGALAFHWGFQRSGTPHAGSYDACPITALLVAEDDPAAVHWHRQQHALDGSAGKSGERLFGWLAERSRSEQPSRG